MAGRRRNSPTTRSVREGVSESYQEAVTSGRETVLRVTEGDSASTVFASSSPEDIPPCSARDEEEEHGKMRLES